MKMRSILLSTLVFLLLLFTTLSMSFKCRDTAHLAKPNSKNISNFLNEEQFNALFPQRNKFYSYSAFIRAAAELGRIRVKVTRRATSVYQFIRTDKATGRSVIVRQDADWDEAWAKVKPDSAYLIDYSEFCAEKDLQTNKKELAAFFAQIAHETRNGENGKYNDGLMLIHESNTSLPYIADNDEYPPVAGQKYYGRGPMQLSYNGNYGYASDCIFGNKKILLNNPGLIETDPVVAFKTAIYFWMTPQTRKPSAHDVMTGKWRPNASDKAKGRLPGFGMTINIVNGEIECGKGNAMKSMNDRIGFYRYFLKQLGVTDVNCACSCGQMQPYTP